MVAAQHRAFLPVNRTCRPPVLSGFGSVLGGAFRNDEAAGFRHIASPQRPTPPPATFAHRRAVHVKPVSLGAPPSTLSRRPGVCVHRFISVLIDSLRPPTDNGPNDPRRHSASESPSPQRPNRPACSSPSRLGHGPTAHASLRPPETSYDSAQGRVGLSQHLHPGEHQVRDGMSVRGSIVRREAPTRTRRLGQHVWIPGCSSASTYSRTFATWLVPVPLHPHPEMKAGVTGRLTQGTTCPPTCRRAARPPQRSGAHHERSRMLGVSLLALSRSPRCDYDTRSDTPTPRISSRPRSMTPTSVRWSTHHEREWARHVTVNDNGSISYSVWAQHDVAGDGVPHPRGRERANVGHRHALLGGTTAHQTETKSPLNDHKGADASTAGSAPIKLAACSRCSSTGCVRERAYAENWAERFGGRSSPSPSRRFGEPMRFAGRGVIQPDRYRRGPTWRRSRATGLVSASRQVYGFRICGLKTQRHRGCVRQYSSARRVASGTAGPSIGCRKK